jgi:hypothetical protein
MKYARTISLCTGLALAAGAAAQTITQWNFNTTGGNTAGTLTPSIGAGSVVRLGAPQTAFRAGNDQGGSSDPAGDVNNAALDLSPWAAQGTGSGLNGIEFRVSTAGYSDIVVNYDHRHSNRMSRWTQFQYSIDGATFTSAGLANDGVFEASNDGDTWYNGRQVDLTGIDAADDNPSFAFRIVAVFAPGTSTYVTSGAVPYDTGGRSRFDMVTVRQQSTPSFPTGELDTIPEAACAGGSGTILLVCDTRPGAAPASTGITVDGDLTAIGGSATQPFYDDGTNGDATPNDGRFSFLASVPVGVVGRKSVTATTRDAQGRSSSDTEAFQVADCGGDSGSAVVISQIFSGGGNFGADYNADFVELFNRSQSPVDISSWTLQYASDDNAFELLDNVLTFAAGTIIPPGGYYLIQTTNTLGVNGVPFIADRTGAPGFGIGQTNGKLALVSNQTLLGDQCPTENPAVVDFVGYGLGANCSEGASPTVDNNVTTSLFRLFGGCQDTNQNFADFVRAAPAPRTSADAAAPCPARCPADYNMDGGVDGADVQAFFNDWETGLSNADVNLDGGVDGGDVETFFVAWEAGGC